MRELASGGADSRSNARERRIGRSLNRLRAGPGMSMQDGEIRHEPLSRIEDPTGDSEHDEILRRILDVMRRQGAIT